MRNKSNPNNLDTVQEVKGPVEEVQIGPVSDVDVGERSGVVVNMSHADMNQVDMNHI